MKPPGPLLVGLLVVGLLSAGCSPAGGQPRTDLTPSDRSCSVSTLELGPDGFDPYGLARAGPIWFSAFGRVSPGTPATLARDGEPYDGWKVVIHPDPNSSGMVDVSGVQCSLGKAVRFCYGACNWNARLQMSVVTLHVNAGSHLDSTGYMVFPGPGLMRLSASDSNGVVSTVVIEVPQISTASAGVLGANDLWTPRLL
jgi:hypothetical protein